MSQAITIASRHVGPGHPVFIVGELSANHNQSFEHAQRIVRAAADAGADAIKLQTYTADTMTLRCDRAEFKVGGGTLWDGRLLYDLYQEAYTPWEWQPELARMANDLGMVCFSTAFDATSVDFLEGMDVPVHKVASFELNDLPLIARVAATRRPLILSTGMATEAEIDDAVTTARSNGASEILLLKCTSAYPAAPESMNLSTIPAMSERFGCPVGLSDHTPGSTVPIAAVPLGACMVEKHMTMRRADGGPDSAFSMEPDEFAEMVQAVRATEKAFGSPTYGPSPDEISSLAFRRSLFVAKPMKAGDIFTEENVRSIRPSHGLPPKRLADILGKRAAADIEVGTPLSESLIV